MKDFQPYFTNDGSVGLYNSEFDDIYHSSTGALTEAYEKFVYPINFESLLKKDSIKVLDICYGIGYNSKSFLNFILKNKILLSIIPDTNAPIHTDKISRNKTDVYNDKIYADNIFSKISITAIDNDKFLSCLSPFIKTGKSRFKNNNSCTNKKNIDKYLKKRNKIKTKKIDNLINFLIFEKIAQNISDFYENEAVISIMTDKNSSIFFEGDIKGIYLGKIYNRYKTMQRSFLGGLYTYLHNIYYNHIAKRYKNALKRYNLQGLSFTIKNDDARTAIKNDSSIYNLIFLDAFTPSKCPCLWSYDFFKMLYNKLDNDGMLLTYSISAAIRSAMIEAGFYIGNIYNQRENKFTGTIAVKNTSLIKYPLSDYDLGLLKTTAGIFYRDDNLTGLNEAIIETRKIEVENSDRLSTSQYKKQYNKEEKCNNMT